MSDSGPDSSVQADEAMTVASAFETLGLVSTASLREVQTAYRRLAFEYHPDRNPGDARSLLRFKQTTRAFGVLAAKFRADKGRADEGLEPGECAACGMYTLLRAGLDGNRYCQECHTLARRHRSLPAPAAVIVSCGFAIVALLVSVVSLALFLGGADVRYGVVSLAASVLALLSLTVTCLTVVQVARTHDMRRRR